MKKKITSVLLTLVLLFQIIPISKTVFASTDSIMPTVTQIIDNVTYYVINTGKELAYIAQTGGDWLGYNYILANDIVLNDVELTYDENGNLTVDASTLNQWTPINGFKGIFDGNGHSISGVYVNTTSSAGFFANCRGDVSNLRITNSYIKGGSNVGGICGSFNETGKDMVNCFYDGAVIGTSNIGGLIGLNNATNISKCGNYGDVWGTGNYVCGIVGSFYAYGIDDCFNEGNITSTGDYVAGIAGSSDTYSINNCVNKGNITGRNYVAGICGKIEKANIWSCGNTGIITGTDYIGGICGYSAYGYVESWTSNISSSYNTGAIYGNSYVGGITGYTNYADVYSCYNVGDVKGQDNVGAVIGKSESVWGKGTASGCYYLKNDSVNINLNGFGNAPDAEGVTKSEGTDFFCINEDKTLNISGHSGGIASCTEKAKCPVCGAEYGYYTAHTLTHHDYVAPDYENNGNIEYWTCDDCGKYFSDADGLNEITADDIVIAKLVVSKYQFIDGEIIIEAPAGAIPEGALFDVQKIVPPPAEVVEKVKEQMGDSSEVLAYYEIRLSDMNGELIIRLDDEITIKTKMPEQYTGSNCVRILQEDETGKLITMESWWENDYLCYKTDWLEIYN